MASTAAANFQAFAASTLGEWQSQQPAQATKTWWEPLGSQSAGQAAKPGGTHASAALTTLYRSPDIHARIVAMSKWFFQHDAYNELLQMVGECYGNGRLVEPTFTLLEGQAIANNPIFAGKAQQLGITAFYDYVFTVDWMAHRLDMVENILKTLSSMGRGGGNLGDVRFFQEQLDTMLMSPQRVPWYMWDDPKVRMALVDPVDGMRAKGFDAKEELRLLSNPMSQVAFFQDYADAIVKGTGIDVKSSDDTAFDIADELRCIRLAAQEAILLSSPLWNELCAIGQGLFRVYLTKAATGIGSGNNPVAQGSFVNAFDMGTLPINVIPARHVDIDNVIYPFGYTKILDKSKDVDKVVAFIKKSKISSTPITRPHTFDKLETDGAKETSIVVASAPLETLTFDAVLRGLLQPKCTNLLLFACFAVEWEKRMTVIARSIPASVVAKYTELRVSATKQKDTSVVRNAVLESQKHTGSGGAIGTYICNGTCYNGRFLMISQPAALVVTSDMVSAAMKAQTHHPIHHCADLATAMRRGLAFSAADMAASKLDAFYQPKSAPQNLFEHLRARLRELENRYALVRSASANDDQHPVATADKMFTDSFLGYGPHAKLPQCPAGSLPMIFDSIHNKSLSAEQWQKQVVRINGEPMLPAHLQIQGCMPARRADSDPNPTSSTTNVFQGLLGQLKL